MNSLVIIVCLIGPLFAFHAHNLLREHGPPIKIKRSSRSTKEPEFHYITQRVDNFNASDLRTWTMRYLSNDEFFQYGGPIFIFLGGEWKIETSFLRGGQMFEMAREHNGYMFYTEHRYYGESFPVRVTSVDSLRYLSSHQALADIAHFVRYIKSTYQGLSYSKVVVVGCSYAANLATWIRLIYPEVIDAAYASSGPVKAVADFYGYLETVSNDISVVSQECKRTVSEAFAQLEEKLKSYNGVHEMSRAFYPCVPIRNTEPDRSTFFSYVIYTFGNYAQSRGLKGLGFLCSEFLRYPGTALEKLIVINNRYNEYNRFCRHEHMKTISDIEYRISYDPWSYQTCTEFGYYQTTNFDNPPFGHTVSLDLFIHNCKAMLGGNFGLDTLQNNIDRTNLIYGGLTPNVTKVLSVHGSADPWHSLGILKDLNPLAPAIFIDGTTHCQDLGTPEVDDTYQLWEARIRAREIIAKWIKQL